MPGFPSTLIARLGERRPSSGSWSAISGFATDSAASTSAQTASTSSAVSSRSVASRIAGAWRAQGGEDLLGEAVDGRDRGRVEVDEGPLQAIEAAARGRCCGEQREQLVVGSRCRQPSAQRDAASVSRVRTRSRSSAAAARVKVTMRSSVDRDVGLGHVADDEPGERVGLAGACARLDRDTAARAGGR